MTRLALVLVSVAGVAAGCGEDHAATARALTGGDPERGRTAIRARGCTSCHDIPGAEGRTPRVGPPLAQLGERSYLAGHVPNTPDGLVRWIRFPQQVLPGNAMPDMAIGEAEARDIAAYLYTLRR